MEHGWGRLSLHDWKGACGAFFDQWTQMGTTTSTSYDLPIQDDTTQHFSVVESAW